jgi:putative tryptophan/tyrosine transport system substrate-binding protein
MRRRDFIAGLGGAAMASCVSRPLVAHAQQGGRVRRINWLSGLSNDSEGQINVAAFVRGLQALGWKENVEFQMQYRWADGNNERIRTYAVELVGLRPDVILAEGSRVLGILWQQTRTVPIVFVNAFDPVDLGFVASLSKPGGNITGFTQFENAIAGKWLQLLKEVAPSVVRVALIGDPDTPSNKVHLRTVETIAASLGVMPIATPIHGYADIERAIETFAREPDSGLIVLPDVTTTVHRAAIAAVAAHRRLPAIYASRYFATDGGLLSYGINSPDLYFRAASYIDRILKGDKPADLPVQQPTKYELVINLRSAKALGLTVPQSILLRADEVIE